ncbi:MAG TPA: DUF1501 domain-containing protein [Pyrinomonadaceae bacterium]|jgi:uncharacterized protein (DUF1501 family)|nr:DUF1501 domain-containing protein [Pyrinomonadaceae bacterium]
MSTTRRNFLRQGVCALGGVALASSLTDFALVNALAAQDAALDAATDYRALVCIFLNGGNDGNNMIVPLDAEYDAYSTVRAASTLAIDKAALLPANTPPRIPRPFGFHPNMPEVRDLFNLGKLGVQCNVGPLVEPLTKTTYQNGTGKRPYQLFSHSDQVTQWQNAVSNTLGQSGWGGRIGDRAAGLNGAATFPQLVSISGVSLFVTGVNTRPLAISDARTSLSSVLPLSMTQGAGDGLFPFLASDVAARRVAFDQMRALDQSAMLVKAGSDLTTSALQTSQALSVNPTINTIFPESTNNFDNLSTLSAQLLQVAKIIKLRDTLGMKRQIFFCSLGAFDTHNNQRGAGASSQDSLLRQVSRAMKAFYEATIELGVESNVTTFTISDFGRTLQPAGSGAQVGTDHAWGNHQLIMGGAVRGGDLYGTFPTLALRGPDDADTRGRWIPTTSIEQYAATLATWYGLSPTDVPLVFPLINRFSSPNLGFMF